MDGQNLGRLIDDVVAPRRLLDHPFYRRWSAGGVSREELREYAAQFRHFEALVPEILGTIATTTPDPVLREGAERNLADETGRPSHLELLDGFLDAIGAVPAGPTPAMRDLLAIYRGHARTSAVAGLGAVLAYEQQAGDVARTKVAALREHHDLDGSAVRFWDVHADADVEHARWLVDTLVQASADAQVIADALRDACDAWLGFLDEREAARAA